MSGYAYEEDKYDPSPTAYTKLILNGYKSKNEKQRQALIHCWY